MADKMKEPPTGCPVPCRITWDEAMLPEADAVVFHIPISGLPVIPKLPGQIWVARSMESDVNVPILRDPELMSRFDLTMTYRRDSDVWTPYFLPWQHAKLLTPSQPKIGDALAVCFITSDTSWSGRREYLQELMTYIPVACYGRLFQNRFLADDPGPHTGTAGAEAKRDTIAKYKFTLAFENSITQDYVTEKLYHALIAGSVPVYLGAPNVAEFAPADHCYIDVRDFSGPRELAAYLHALSEDEEAYGRYLAWKQCGLSTRFVELSNPLRLGAFCRLCLKVRDLRSLRRSEQTT